MKPYRMILAADRPATVGFVPTYNSPTPTRLVAMAKIRAPRVETRPRTIGRLRVRDMRASYLGSKNILNALALAEERKVPAVRYKNVSVEVERVGS